MNIRYQIMHNKILSSETRQCKAIFPNSLNANETLFGGEALKWMDEVAFITATRFTRQKMYTVNTENIRFLKPVAPNSIVEVIGKIEKVEALKISVKVEIYMEEMYSCMKEKAIEGVFVFVSLDENKKPRKLDFSKWPFENILQSQ
jgi:acyl-CoA hydrolase